MKAYYAIDMSRIGLDTYSAWHFKSELLEKMKSLPSIAPAGHLAPIKALGGCYGPFETEGESKQMAASELNEKGRDFFGVKWCFIEAEMEGSVFEKVLIPKKYFVCTDADCGSHQRFKGFCSQCKFNGKEMVETRAIRDWNNILGA